MCDCSYIILILHTLPMIILNIANQFFFLNTHVHEVLFHSQEDVHVHEYNVIHVCNIKTHTITSIHVILIKKDECSVHSHMRFEEYDS